MKIGLSLGPTSSIITTQTAAILSAAGPGFTIDNANFDGSTGLRRESPGLSGISDGKQWAFSFWFKLDSEDTNTHVIFTTRDSSSNRFLLQRSPSAGQNNRLTLVGRNTSGTVILLIETSASYNTSTNAGWNHILCSGNLATGAKHIYVNDGSDINSSGQVFTNDNIDFTGSFEIGRANDITHLPFYGSMAEFWMDDSYIDFSVEANRRKFYSATGTAVDLGSDGSTPTGSSPLMYLHLDDGETGNNFALNAGTGGDFSVSAGAITTTGDAPGGITIASIRESRVFTWDALTSSTSQTIANQEASPADSSSQTTYDVRQGTSTGSDSRDPSYDATNKYYYQASGSSLDFLTMQGFKTTTAFTNSLHKAGAEFTVEMGAHIATATPPGATGLIASTAEDTNDTGVSFRSNSANKLDAYFHKGTAGVFLFTLSGDNAVSDGAHHIVFSLKADGTSFCSVDGSYYQFNSLGTDTFTLDYTTQTPSTGSSTHNWHFLTSLLDGNTSNPRFQMGQNSGLGYFAVYNKAVTKAEADILRSNAPSRYQV